MYKELIAKSWKDVRQNLVLIVPNLMFIALLLASGFLFVILSGLSEIFMQLTAMQGNQERITAYLQSITISNVGAIIGYGLVWIMLLFVGFFLARAVTLGMMADLIKKKKQVLGNASQYIKKYFWRLIGLNISVMFVFFLAVVLSVVVGIMASLITVFIIPLIVICAVIGILWLYCIFFFSKQVLLCENKTAIEAMKESKKVFTQNKKGMIKSILVVWGITIIVSLILSGVGLIPFIGAIVEQIGFLVLSVWAELFTFYMYSKRKELK